jgi:hypothetical protein
MRDDQLSRLLRQADEPARPGAAFADRLFEQLSREAGGSRRGHTALLLVAAVVLMGVLAFAAAVAGGLVKVHWLTADVSPAPTVEPTASPEETPSAAPSAPTASPTSQPSVAPSTPTAEIAIDGLVKSTVNSLRVRAKPTTTGDVLGTIDKGQLGFVVAGPVAADGYGWYQLSGVGLPPNAGCEPPVQTNPFNCPNWLGWVAAGQTAGQPWLKAATVTCPASPMNLDALVAPETNGPTTALERLACYGSTPIQFRAWWPEIPPDAGLGGACGGGDPGRPGWLMCQNVNYNGLVISESAGFEGIGLKVSIDPASGVTMPPRGQWVEVLAHLDDPAARECTPLGGGDQDPVSVVLTCRSELVADSVKPVAGPY